MLNDEKVNRLLAHLYNHQRFLAHSEIKNEKILTVSEEQHLALYELLLHHRLIRRMYVKSDESSDKLDAPLLQITEKGKRFCEHPSFKKLYKKWTTVEGMLEDPAPIPIPNPNPNPAPSPKPNPVPSPQPVSDQKPMNMKIIIGVGIVIVLAVIIWYFATH
jgi:hypothetical protein